MRFMKKTIYNTSWGNNLNFKENVVKRILFSLLSSNFNQMHCISIKKQYVCMAVSNVMFTRIPAKSINTVFICSELLQS